MRFASVILDIPTQALDAPYTYAVPEAPAEAGGYDVEVGCAVLVPFGHRQAVGFVVGLQELPDGEAPAGIDAAKVKPVVRAVSPAYFDEEGAACAQWLSERYLAPLSSCVRLFTPPGGVPRMVRAQAGYWRLEEPAVGEVDDRWVLPGAAFDGFEPRKNAVKQASIVEALQAGELRVAELAAEFGAVSSTLKALEKQGVVRIERRRRMRGMAPDVPGAPAGPGASGASGFTPSPKPRHAKTRALRQPRGEGRRKRKGQRPQPARKAAVDERRRAQARKGPRTESTVRGPAKSSQILAQLRAPKPPGAAPEAAGPPGQSPSA